MTYVLWCLFSGRHCLGTLHFKFHWNVSLSLPPLSVLCVVLPQPPSVAVGNWPASWNEVASLYVYTVQLPNGYNYVAWEACISYTIIHCKLQVRSNIFWCAEWLVCCCYLLQVYSNVLLQGVSTTDYWVLLECVPLHCPLLCSPTLCTLLHSVGSLSGSKRPTLKDWQETVNYEFILKNYC